MVSLRNKKNYPNNPQYPLLSGALVVFLNESIHAILSVSKSVIKVSSCFKEDLWHEFEVFLRQVKRLANSFL